MEALLAKEREHIALLIKQREELLRQSPTSTAQIPWYVWTVLGIAGGVVLTRGIR